MLLSDQSERSRYVNATRPAAAQPGNSTIEFFRPFGRQLIG
jgi:hypothetical protein